MKKIVAIEMIALAALLLVLPVGIAAPIAGSSTQVRDTSTPSGKKSALTPEEQARKCLEMKMQGIVDKDCKLIPLPVKEPANGEIVPVPQPPVELAKPESVAPERGRDSWQCPASYHCECHGSGFVVECHLNQNGSTGPQSCKDLNNPPGTCPGAVWGY